MHESVEARTEGLSSLRELGPPDLVHLVKQAPRNPTKQVCTHPLLGLWGKFELWADEGGSRESITMLQGWMRRRQRVWRHISIRSHIQCLTRLWQRLWRGLTGLSALRCQLYN